MKNFKKDLQNVNKALNELSKKVEKMIAAAGEPEKPQASKVKPTKKAAAKTPAAKKTDKLSATDSVLNIIKRSRKGIDTAGLKNKTGFKERKIWDAIKKLKKQGKIKSDVRGIYVKA
jgi:uncharacterized membrane protein